MCKCLYCYKPLNEEEKDYHAACAKQFYGMYPAPTLNYKRSDMDRLAREVIETQTTLTGVQPKLSLHVLDHEGSKRLTIVGLWGAYIFKPQTEYYAQLPEVEDVTMHLAEIAGIRTVPHALIRLEDGELGYITKRVDRTKDAKVPQEDFCQLCERLTEAKYKSSYEQVGKVLRQYSSVPMLDCTEYMKVLLFCFVTGNNDMHLKNFSLQYVAGEYRLTPAYDLLNATIVNPEDPEEMALTLNGRKRKLKYRDFVEAAQRIGLTEKYVAQVVKHFRSLESKWTACIDHSFLSIELKQAYKELVSQRLTILEEHTAPQNNSQK